MGQKTNPVGFRLGVIRDWESNWYDERDFSKKLKEDLMLRKYIRRRLQNAGISQIHIERTPQRITLTVHTARPGIVIGRKGAEVDKLKEELQRITEKEIQLNVNEVKKPELDAYLVGENVARQLEAKISFRRVMKRALMATMRMGAEGVRISCAGRLGGAEMARRETYRDGRIPLHTLRADIDYAGITARTQYGSIGIKVWICKGEILGTQGV
ncbi:30S ribosomal protein S3 [candidate division KSB1 bacterium]|nr:30S ribosomal protein S3 [candidate division KSB1 bacterium]NIR70237.1 30S ribosomal protein S3 [candidate division KSB1 bacterium]NIS26508.1 30S ribosomal protein S3 [candidate division KSB1 bacterium]NIT73270.1 30S ribosomal protein S3 [candidate division KSB1 bacterium]NIU23894.1 30S ribosomal protein S3 [candidate division KSB1 bacterium]